MIKNFVETPYGDIYRDELNKELVLEFETDDFGVFSPDIAIDNEIDHWLIDHDYKILKREMYFNDPILDSLNYVYYNEETNDYEEVEIPIGFDSTVNPSMFLLRYKLAKK